MSSMTTTAPSDVVRTDVVISDMMWVIAYTLAIWARLDCRRSPMSTLTSRLDPDSSDLPSAVLFDMDGTLIDSEPLWHAVEVEVMNELGGVWSQADQEHCLGGPLERISAYMVDRSGTQHPPQEVGRRLLDRMTVMLSAEPLTWRPGARELLRQSIELGIPRALVTASWGVLVDAVSGRMHEDIGADPFTVVVTGDQIANGKPHPEPYQRAAREVGIPPGSCLAIEDSPTGVRSASSAGCVVVAVPHLTTLPADLSDVLVVGDLAGWTVPDLWREAVSKDRRPAN